VLHALERQMQRLESGWATPGARFMCGVAGGQRLVGARLGIVFDAKGAANGYVVSFAELGEEETALAKRDDLLELATEELRAPIANLRAAAETLYRLEPRALFEKPQGARCADASAGQEVAGAVVGPPSHVRCVTRIDA
jgi:hypothetical protein